MPPAWASARSPAPQPLTREIQQLHDFDQHVLLCSAQHTSDWASAMRLVTLKAEQEQRDLEPSALRWHLNRMRSDRILRYRRFQALIDQAFDTTICELVQEESSLLQRPDLGADRLHLALHAQRSRQR